MKETADLPSTVRGSQGFGNTGLKDSSKDRKDSSRVSVMQRIQGKPTIKKTSQCRMQRELVSMKQMKKLMKQKEIVFLCIIKVGEETLERKRRSRGSKKPKASGFETEQHCCTELPRSDRKDEAGAQQGCGPQEKNLKRSKKRRRKQWKAWRKNTRRI